MVSSWKDVIDQCALALAMANQDDMNVASTLHR
jgi:hypothetical protein